MGAEHSNGEQTNINILLVLSRFLSPLLVFDMFDVEAFSARISNKHAHDSKQLEIRANGKSSRV